MGGQRPLCGPEAARPRGGQAPGATPSRLSTLVAVRYRAEWRERYQRLVARGCAKKEALTILSRGLLKVIYHLLRTGTAYDPARVGLQKPGS
jgi:hypothetical protein